MISEELKNDIVEWHKMQFPDAKYKDVRAKIVEENLELEEALSHFREELADVMIVATAFSRYKLTHDVLKALETIKLNLTKSAILNDIDIEEEVKKKMAINKKRDWSKRK